MKERKKKKREGKKRDTISPKFPSPPPFITSLEKSKLFILSHSCLALLSQIQQIQKEWLRNTFSLSSPTIQVLLGMERALFSLAKLHTSTKATHSAKQEKSLPHSLQIMTGKGTRKGLSSILQERLLIPWMQEGTCLYCFQGDCDTCSLSLSLSTAKALEKLS